ncbi:hypothetical protein O181_079631, partial [Austropuccinia psidii MF-1]|nr:hypothetical protein [Austropuccinia psidii MF-1]
MISQSSSHQFDHSLSQQPPHSHHRHVSNASSIGSIDSGLGSFDYTHYHHPNPSIHNTFTLPASFGDNLSASAAFGGVPVSADAFHQYPPHHHRSSSTSSSPPFTEPTSISGGNSPEGFSNASNVPGGRKPSQAQMMRRARTHASPYTIRNNSLSWDGVDQSGASSSGQLRSHSVTSEATSTTEDELVELLRTHSRESSLSDWNMASASQPQSSAPNPYQNGLGPAGAFMDPYAAVANVHGHAGAFGPTMVSLGNGASNSIDGLVHTGIVGAPGMVNNSIVGGMGNQMGRMTLDCTETYEALAHHIRTAVTTSAADRARQAFVQAWLNSSYISYTDGNVSRQGLYGSYLRICQEYDIKPINSASFGKAVRQSYPNIKTRRLGVRGNSKYHYCGIRPATAKEAEILMALSRSEQPEPRSGRSQSLVDDEIDSETSPTRRVSAQPGLIDDNQHAFLSLNGDTSQPQTPKTARPSMSSLAMSSSQNGLSDHNPQGGEYPLPFPNLDEALNQAFAQDLDHQVARAFWKIYVEHSHCLLEYVKNNRFDQ